MVNKKSVLAGVGLALAGALTFVGTTSLVYAATTPPSDVPPKLIENSAKLQGEYLESISDISVPLPDGVKYPASSEVVLGENTVADPGVGASYANFYWKCAWEDAYFDALATKDPNAAKSALTTLGSWESLPFVKAHVVDPERIWYSGIYKPAFDGDTRLLYDEFSNGCQFYDAFN